MGDKEEEAVENGEVESVVEKKDDATDGVKDMEEDSKDEEKVRRTEMKVDNAEAGEPETEAVEKENGEKSQEENKDKVESALVDNQSAGKDPEKTVSTRKCRKEKPKVAEENTKNNKTVEKKKKEPKTPASDHPVCERKSVERHVATIEKDSGKELHIEKGRGTALKDIPNVAHKLSRKKNEETYKLLHTILFGRRGKASQVKSNISQFSGFVWHANEDKQKNKIKEKLDKCVEEKLLEFCNVLDLPIAKTTARKEDVVTELLEFFEAPQATSDELLADKEVSSKGNKRKRSSKKSTSNLGAHLQKAQLRVERGMSMHLKARRKRIHVKRTMIKEQEDDDVHGEQENVDSSSDGSEDEKPEHAKSEEKETDTGAESKEATKKRKRVTEAVEEKSPIPKKSTSKDIAGKKLLKGKEKKPKGEKLKPSDTELKNATCELLKEVDCNTATITDILKLLVERFNTDLVPRISTIRRIILDEIKAKGEKLKPSDTELQNATCELLKELKPSDTELKNATCELLKEVDCKTVTIIDILKLLVERFNTDLVPRKSTIRRIIMDEIKAKGEKLKPSDTELKNATCEPLKELKPSDTELKNATCELLKEVDCKTATITDILKLLVKRFNTDLVPRKSTIRRIIMDEIKAKGEKLKPSDTELKNAKCELLKELKPSDTELKNATFELLKEVDCKTATITDILKLLVKRFNTDLVPRKSTIRRIILDELNKMF